jgi:hypothetical protein
VDPEFIQMGGILKPPRFIDPTVLGGVDITAGGPSTGWDRYLKLPKEPGAKLGPTAEVLAAEGKEGSKPGTGIHDASTLARLNEHAERRQLVDAVLGEDARGWSPAQNEMAFRIASGKPIEGDLGIYAQNPKMRAVVTRARQLFTEAWEATQGPNPTLKITGFHEDYVPHVNPYENGSFEALTQELADKSADLDMTHPSKTRLEMKREDLEGRHPYRLTDAVEAYASAIAKQRNLDPVNRTVLEQIAAARETGSVDPQTIQFILDQQNHSFMGRPTDFEIEWARAPVVRQSLAGALYTLDKLGYPVNRSKPLSSMATFGADLVTMLQVSPLRAATSHLIGDVIKKGMEGKFSNVPAQFARGMAKRLKLAAGMDSEQFQRYVDSGIISDFWRLEPTDSRLKLLPKALRAPFQAISFFDDAAKIATVDEMNQKFVAQGLPKDVAWQRAVLATIRQQNFTEAIHMPNVAATPFGQAYGLFQRSRLTAANDAVRWLKSQDGVTYMKGLGVVGTLALLSSVGVDAWQRVHMLPELEDGLVLPPAASMMYGMYKQARDRRLPSFWFTRILNPKGDTPGQKALELFGLRKKSAEEKRQLEFMRLRH